MATGTLAAATTISGRTAVSLINGASPTATDGDAFTSSGREYLAVYNPEASGCTLTFTIPAVLDGQAVPSKTATVATLTTAIVGPFPTSIYNDGSGKTKVTCALDGAGSLANVKLKVVKFA